jgi:hypothetical protein
VVVVIVVDERRDGVDRDGTGDANPPLILVLVYRFDDRLKNGLVVAVEAVDSDETLGARFAANPPPTPESIDICKGLITGLKGLARPPADVDVVERTDDRMNGLLLLLLFDVE